MSANEIDQNSLEALFARAEILGEISVRPRINGYRHEVAITYLRRSGTLIRAVGLSNSISDALQRALAEASLFKS